jgi:hypothetical protein
MQHLVLDMIPLSTHRILIRITPVHLLPILLALGTTMMHYDPVPHNGAPARKVCDHVAMLPNSCRITF